MFSLWINLQERTIKLWRFIPCNKPFLSASSILTKEVCMAQARASAQMLRHPCGWFLKCMVAGVKSGFELSWKQQFAGKMRKCHINRKPRLRFFQNKNIPPKPRASYFVETATGLLKARYLEKMTNFPGIIKHNTTSWGGVTCRSGPATKNKHPVEAPCPNLIHILWLSSDLRCRKPGGCVRRSYKKNGSGRRKFHHIEVVNQPENQMAGKSWLNLRLLPRQGFWQAASFMSSSGSFTFSLLRTVTLSCTTRTVAFIKVSGRMIKTQLSVGI